ncbi:MAG TPA: hypothetical protein ENL19_00365 [candidate division WOR-3 bacterium]|uniref:Uncharacterized protein n=1 Tax=candidate division WOR-3 bacterium TaxID=2052148 RepID=A0A7C5HFD0_UNCW3|nr:hypothetical protein [candidate division WOR-3 bacterium]
MPIFTAFCFSDIAKIEVLLSKCSKNLKEDTSTLNPTIEDILEELYLLLHLKEEKKIEIEITYGNIRNIDREVIQESISSIKKIIKRECSGKGSLEIYKKFITYWMMGMSEVNIFTTNWDSLIEITCDKLHIKCIDGFSGIYEPFIDLAVYDDEIRRNGEKIKIVKLFKIHGSIDWIKERGSIRKKINSQSEVEDEIMIYPTPLKTREVLSYPYSELLRRLDNEIRGKSKKLLIIGYSFPDSHINDIIKQALQNESFSLFIIDPNLTIENVQSILGDYPGIFDPISTTFEKFVDLLTSEVT